jgi:hypothetical protein
MEYRGSTTRLSFGYHLPEMPHRPAPIERDIQNPESGLRRIPLLRTPVNKDKKRKGGPEPYFSARTQALPSGEVNACYYSK